MIGQIRKRTAYFWNAVKADLGIEGRKSPQILSYLITSICNSHCITCNAWRCKELKYIETKELRERLASPLFSGIKHVGISGGEPSTFDHLTEQIDVLLTALPKMRTLSITSNCIRSDYWQAHLEEIHRMCTERGVAFQMNVSLDGVGQKHDKIRGTKGNFEQTERVIRFAQEKKIPFQLHTTINRHNVYHVGAILHYAKTIGADIIFRLASEICRLDNDGQIARIALNAKESSFFCDFLRSKALHDYTRSPARKIFYKNLAMQLLGNRKRLAPCYFKQHGLVLSSDGNLSFCSRFAEGFGNLSDDDGQLVKDFQDKSVFEKCCAGECAECYHDQSGVWPLHILADTFLREKFSAFYKMGSVVRYHAKAIGRRTYKTVASPVTDVAICGMYGGEHVGDAAILGGVICRLRSRYPSIRKVSVYSFRPDRTRCWVGSLADITDEIDIEVIGNEKHFVRQLSACQLLVWGGGPLMELPIVLSRNDMFVKRALAAGCRFEIEGAGYGPINSAWGRKKIDRILKSSSRTTVRSEMDANKLAERDVQVDESQPFVDPAFDYLRRVPECVAIDEQEKRVIERLLSKEDNQKILALNLRPLWNRYGKCDTFDFNVFLDEVAKMIRQLSEQNVVTVFFPMNADQFGFSDFDVAYALRDRLGENDHFRIWETEPSIQSAIYLLRHADAALCMRFHAVIFSLSQGLKTYGLDYSLQGNGKVATLFKGQEGRCFSIRDFKAENMTKAHV